VGGFFHYSSVPAMTGAASPNTRTKTKTKIPEKRNKKIRKKQKEIKKIGSFKNKGSMPENGGGIKVFAR